MRRSEKQITDQKELNEILLKNHICRIALSDNNTPYIIPVNYGYDEKYIFIHSAVEGHKLDIIRKNNKVCFEITDSIDIVAAESACDFGTKFRSVIGFGKIKIVSDSDRKINALRTIMHQHTKKNLWNFNEISVSKIVILEIKIESLTGKKSGV